MSKKEMTGNLWKILFFLLSTFCIFTNGFSIHSNNQTKSKLEQDLTIRAVHKILHYLENNPETINDDVLFGVILAKANLNWLIDRCQNIPSVLTEIFEIIMICDKILEENPSQSGLIRALSVIWENGAGDLNYGSLTPEEEEEVKFILPKFETCQNIQEFIMKNVPENSDACIAELFDSDCHPSDNCLSSEQTEKTHFGYATTHLLLYSQIALRLNCHRKSEQFSGIKLKIEQFCRSMLMEARAFYDQPYFSLVRDLFLEQTALCGVEGYAEFAPKAWRKEVLRWQSEKGCFGHDMPFGRCSLDSPPNKRTDYLIDGCHTHVTAVALATLAFHLRYEFDADLVSDSWQKALISSN